MSTNKSDDVSVGRSLHRWIVASRLQRLRLLNLAEAQVGPCLQGVRLHLGQRFEPFRIYIAK